MIRDLAGVAIRVEADDPRVEAAVAARVRRLAAPANGHADLVFRYATSPSPGAAIRPASTGRPVYDPPTGRVLFHEDEDTLTIQVDGCAFAAADAAAGTTTVELDRRAPLWLLSRPMFTLPLLEQLKRRGRYGVHAGGVARDGRAILLAGSSGSGKSTLTLACVSAGLDFMADDLVFLRTGDDGIQAVGLAEDADVLPETVALLPELGPVLPPREPGFAKHAVAPDADLAARVARSATPAVIVFPAIAGTRHSRLEPVGAAEALLALVPDMLLTAPAPAQAQLAVLRELVGSCRCYRLATGRDLGEAAATVSSLLD